MILSVPNVSEGRRPAVLSALASAVAATPGARLLDWSADADHNRSVFTLTGDEASLVAAIEAIYDIAATAIDLRTHRGVHPRIGAVDVVPFVPFGGTALEPCVALARRAGRLVAERHQVPVFLYEAAATRPSRRNLADVRRGGFEGLAARMRSDVWAPDFGPAAPHPALGASAVGARRVLVAYNVNLESDRLDAAQAIARAIRERDGGLKGVKAMGVRLRTRSLVQVSMNLTDYELTNMADAFAAVEREAARHGIRIRESELIGLAPAAAFGGAAPADLRLQEASAGRILEHRLQQIAP